MVITKIVDWFIRFSDKRKNYNFMLFLINIWQVILYLLYKDIATSLFFLVITFISFLYVHRDKFKGNVVPFSSVILEVIIAIFTINNNLQYLSLGATCFTRVYLWFSRTGQQIRVCNVLYQIAMLIYNVLCRVWIMIPVRVYLIGFNIYTYVRSNRLKSLDNT